MPDFYAPKYFDSFRCKASQCENPCCAAGWEIPIDGDSYAFYLDKAPEIAENTRFDGDGDRIFRLREDGACVYFSSAHLCDLMIKTVRQCEICTKYPRFFDEYDGFTEAGISVSCPTAAGIVLSAKPEDYADIGNRPTDDPFLRMLLKVRKNAMARAFAGDPDEAADEIVGYAFGVQRLIDYGEIERLDEVKFELARLIDDDELDRVRGLIYEKSEILSERWRVLINPQMPMAKAFERDLKQKRGYLAYLIYRYFLKAISDDDLITRAVFIRVMYGLAGNLPQKYSHNVQIISREIEHDDENISLIMEYLLERFGLDDI